MKEQAKKTIKGTAIVVAAAAIGLAVVTWIVHTEEKQYNITNKTTQLWQNKWDTETE